MADVAVIVCTYNPEERLIERTLNAILKQKKDNFEVEYVLVDNNSSTPIVQLKCVKKFLEKNCRAKVVSENQQGLTYARLAGMKASNSPILVYFDDDNEPDADYLINAKRLMDENQCVGAWGAGDIRVEFADRVDDWVRIEGKPFLLERKFEGDLWGKSQYAPAPIGAGHVVRRVIMEHYHDSVNSYSLTMSGRKGKSLSSGEDMQINYIAIKHDFGVGVSASLKLNHLIPKRRCSLSYLKKLHFVIGKGIDKTWIEVFPDDVKNIEFPSTLHLLKNVFMILFKGGLKRKFKTAIIQLSRYLGQCLGKYEIKNEPSPFLINLILFFLKVY